MVPPVRKKVTLLRGDDMQNAAVDTVAHDGTSYSTPRVDPPAGLASTQMAGAVSPKQTSPDRETTPKKSPGSQSIQSPGVLVTEETACVQGDGGQGLTEQFNALGRAFQPEHAAGAGSAGRHREMFDRKQHSPCHQQVSARARAGAEARARVRARPSAYGRGGARVRNGQRVRDVRPRALPPQDKMFDTEDYERSKPAAFLGSTKKRVDEADARAAGLEKGFLGSSGLAVPRQYEAGCSLGHCLSRGRLNSRHGPFRSLSPPRLRQYGGSACQRLLSAEDSAWQP